MWAKLTKHWFLTALGTCYLGGYLLADPLEPLLSISLLRYGVVFVVMWAMGVTLHADTVRKSMTRPLPSLLGIGVNVALVPILCLPAMWFLPDRLFGGLFVTAIVPCTLASASVWTRKAGGDDSIAMMTTVVTNLACVIVVPLGIWLVLAQQVQIDATEQVKKLSILVVLPLLLAQVMRIAGLAGWADRNKPRLSLLGQCGILVMVIFGAITSGVIDQSEPAVEPSSRWLIAASLIFAAVAVHMLSLYLGVLFARILKMPRAHQIAIGIAGSQKTLMVGLQIAIDCGVSVVPMLVYHISQLVIDTVIAERWKERSDQQTESPPD